MPGVLGKSQARFLRLSKRSRDVAKGAGLYGPAQVSYDEVRYLDFMPVPARKGPGIGLFVLEVAYQLWAARNKSVNGAHKTVLGHLVFETRKVIYTPE